MYLRNIFVAFLSVSMDNVTWTYLDEICQDGEIDVSNVNYAQYIKIQDASPMSSNKFNGSADGYDVDAVMVLNNGCGTSSARLAQLDNITRFNVDFCIPESDGRLHHS